MLKPRMTLDDVLADMRARGLPMGKKTLCECLKKGMYPWATVINTGPTGRNSYLILRRDYEAWAEVYLGGN